MDQMADKIKSILRGNSGIVALGGVNVIREAGLNGVRCEQLAYDIEQKYGYDNDEIISSPFFSRRSDIFYDYYKNVILNRDEIQPTNVHKALYKLQQDGKLNAVITRTVYGLYKRAGIQNVIEMMGSAEENRCPNCGKVFGIDYIKHAKDIPCCDQCQVPLRPGFVLLGEMVDNGRMSQSCNAVEQAKVLLILGASIRSPLCQYVVKYYTGDKMILINDQPEDGDELAQYRLYGNMNEIVPYVVDF